MTFWIGVLIGAMGGTTFGALIMAIAAVAKRANDEIERDTRVRQMSDTTNPVQAESDLSRLQVLSLHQDQRRSVVCPSPPAENHPRRNARLRRNLVP